MLPDNDPNLEFSFNSMNITQQDVKDQIHLLNVSKHGGPDEGMPRLIKIACNPLIEPLTQLLNRSIALGKDPSQWKMANISSIFKGKGDDQDPMNYRPISVTSCLSKILEKVIFKYLSNFAQEHNIITKFQSGFRSRDSTVNQLLEIYHQIIENLDKGKEIKFIICDFSKAFDKVWHRGLIYKLKQYGICGNMLKCFTVYLSERKQRVINNGF